MEAHWADLNLAATSDRPDVFPPVLIAAKNRLSFSANPSRRTSPSIGVAEQVGERFRHRLANEVLEFYDGQFRNPRRVHGLLLCECIFLVP